MMPFVPNSLWLIYFELKMYTMNKCSLYGVLTFILFFANDISLLSHSLEGREQQLDAFVTICNSKQLQANHCISKAMVLHTTNKALLRQHLTLTYI